MRFNTVRTPSELAGKEKEYFQRNYIQKGDEPVFYIYAFEDGKVNTYTHKRNPNGYYDNKWNVIPELSKRMFSETKSETQENLFLRTLKDRLSQDRESLIEERRKLFDEPIEKMSKELAQVEELLK